MLSMSPFMNDTTVYGAFMSDAGANFTWGGARDADGYPLGNGDGCVFVEVNDAKTSNNWVKVRAVEYRCPWYIDAR